jgi:hypothetical protein
MKSDITTYFFLRICNVYDVRNIVDMVYSRHGFYYGGLLSHNSVCL